MLISRSPDSLRAGFFCQDCGVTGANAGYGQRWYEVADYMAGPLPLFTVENATFNPDVWADLP